MNSGCKILTVSDLMPHSHRRVHALCPVNLTAAMRSRGLSKWTAANTNCEQKGKHIRLKLSFASFKSSNSQGRKFSGALGGKFPGWEVSSMRLKAACLPRFALLWEQFHQQKLNKTSRKINSARGNEGAVCSERRQRTFSTFKSPLFTPGPPLISRASAENSPVSIVQPSPSEGKPAEPRGNDTGLTRWCQVTETFSSSSNSGGMFSINSFHDLVIPISLNLNGSEELSCLSFFFVFLSLQPLFSSGCLTASVSSC